MSTNQVTIIFCGLPRDLHLFRRSLREFQGSRIIFSSWKEWVNPNLQESLRTLGVEVLLNTEPKPLGHSSIWAQMYALQYALEACESDEIVLKTRSDVYISPTSLQKILARYRAPKIWVPCFEITKPFYIADEVFLGRARDLRKLVNFDTSFDAAASMDGGGETHIRRFMVPYMQEYPALEKFKQHLIRGGYTNLNKPDRFSLLTQRLKESEYLDYLAIYYHVLHRDFLVYNESGGLSWHQAYSNPDGCPFDYSKFQRNFSAKFVCRKTRYKIWCHRSSWISDLVNGKFQDPLAIELRRRMAALA